MLHCNMNADLMQLSLDDLLAELRHARRTDDLGRLAFITYCEVRRWARAAGENTLAGRASDIFITTPHASRRDFLAHVDALISELEQLQARFQRAATVGSVAGAAPRSPFGQQTV